MGDEDGPNPSVPLNLGAQAHRLKYRWRGQSGAGRCYESRQGDPETRIDSEALRGSRYEKAIQLIDPDREIV